MSKPATQPDIDAPRTSSMAVPVAGQHAVAPTRRRYFMLLLILVATVINYLDRVNISSVAPFMTKDLHIDKFHMGMIFSAFAWTYAFALLPAGFLVDRLGSRLSYGLSLVTWSLATAAQSVAGGFASLFGLRLAVGLMEAPAFPANSRAVAMWFPERERGLATSVFVMGQYLGTALFSGILIWIAGTYGWQTVFVMSGAVGLLFGIGWFFWYRDPLKSTANQQELDYLREGGALAGNQERSRFRWADIAYLMRHRQVWAICIGKFASSSSLYFFLTWFPTYLIDERRITLLKAGFFSVMPYVGAIVGILLAGSISDMLIRRGHPMSFSRKLPLVVGSALGMSIVLANVATSDGFAIAILTIAFFAQGISATSWAAVGEVAPKELIGVTSGITSFSANLAGIVTPTVVGYILRETGSFHAAFNFIGCVALVGTLSYSLLLGRLHRIELPQRAR
ncbi:MFS transporter [Robbsia sp. Bb-Pol-6]|uniref:MFS transporter n=1 Tax=Robbsia betulipollinis TaxID=2981849 RepID=A0ABT3ZRC4_9BURK|nr:MFS transporter [Robbsia betulipollinis]MCY0389037.1 MFS transporter [Robbsia betulipollinis]